MASILDILNPLLGPIIDKVFPDPKEKHDFQIKMMEIADQAAAREHDEMMGQIGTNTEEAKSSSLFVAGWRPAVGWIGAVGVGYSCVLEPVMNWTARVIFHYVGNFPILNTDQLFYLVTGMLGFGGMRTYEKIKGVPDSQPTAASTSSVPVVGPQPKKKVLGLPWPF